MKQTKENKQKLLIEAGKLLNEKTGIFSTVQEVIVYDNGIIAYK